MLDRGRGSSIFPHLRILKHNILPISFKNFTGLSYVGSFGPRLSFRISCSLKKIFNSLCSVTWLNEPRLCFFRKCKNFLTTEKSPRHSFLPEFSKTTRKLRPQGACIRQEKKNMAPLPDLHYIWARNVFIAQSHWVSTCPHCANYECSSHSLSFPMVWSILFVLGNHPPLRIAKSHPCPLLFLISHCIKPRWKSSSDLSCPQNLYCL